MQHPERSCALKGYGVRGLDRETEEQTEKRMAMAFLSSDDCLFWMEAAGLSHYCDNAKDLLDGQ